MKRGFTLMELMVTMTILGIIASLSTVSYISVQAKARDAKRKADLTSIGFAFTSRYKDNSCSDQNIYPGRLTGAVGQWLDVTVLENYNDPDGRCEFSQYLADIPTDGSATGLAYQFNLSQQPKPAGHYRLTAKLEATQTLQNTQQLSRMVEIWTTSFGGASLPNGYNYMIGD